jgi:hypothetical protein
MPALTRRSEQWRAFVQGRVGGFGQILALFVLGFYAFANGAAMLHPLARLRSWVSPLSRPSRMPGPIAIELEERP